MKQLAIIVILVLFPFISPARNVVHLRDSVTGESLPYATIVTKEGKKRSFVADEDGYIKLPDHYKNTKFGSTYTGYLEKLFVVGDSDTVFIVRMSPTEHELQEVYIRPQKEKYSKKNNPAVDFVNRLRKASKEYNPENEPYYSYDKYEKTLLAINKFNGQFDSGFMGKHLPQLKNYIDTSNLTGNRLLDLVLKEKYSTRLFSRDPSANKEVTQAYRSEGVDEIISKENMQVLLESVIKEIDVYQPDINILSSRFVSPLSAIGPDFYKYYLTDTVFIGEDECIELSFVPHNAQSTGFNGKIYVPVGDTTMFVKKLIMRTPRDINVNYLRNMFVNQSFLKDSLGNRHKTYDDVIVEMKILPGTPEFYARKTTAYDNFSYDKREDLKDFYHKIGDELSIQDSINATAQFWDLKRMVPMTRAEARMGNLNDELRKVPFLYWSEKVIKVLESGYIGTWKPSKFDIGPLNTVLSYSTSQGWRIKFGGMTTAALSPHFFLRGFIAYTTKTHEWKYGGTIEYSFPRKQRYANEWPKHGFYASYDWDNDFIGERYLFTNFDNFFLSWKRKRNEIVTERQRVRGGYVLELRNNFSVEAGLTYQKQMGTSTVIFENGYGKFIPAYKQAFFNISLRWAKGEKYLQGRTSRYAINNDPWIFQVTQTFGPKGLLGSAYTTNITEISMSKRFWLSAFGNIELILKGGKVWSSVYYPSLLWPTANLSYTIQPEGFSLLDPMEFANDLYGNVDFTYFGNGILFNRIPGINKLKIREVVTFKGLMGTLSDRNNPAVNPNLLVFPSQTLSQKMKPTPYMEIGVGIDNILTFLRVDYVWRLTYRDNPGVDKSGLRISLHFNL